MRSMPWRPGLLLVAGLCAAPALADPAPLAVQGCLGCHGPQGRGEGLMPRLAGREATELDDLLRAYRDDRREGTIMNRIARGYTEAELAAAAAWFAASR